MDSRKKTLLARQVASLADHMQQQSDPEVALSSTTLCQALLDIVNSTAAAMSPEELEDLFFRFSSINQQLEAFFTLARSKMQLDQRTQDAFRHRQTLQQKAEHLQAQLREAQTASDRLTKQVQSDQAALDQQKARLDAANALREKLLAEQQEYAPEKIRQLEKENEALTQQVHDTRARKEALERANHQAAEELQQLNNQIESIPASTRELEQTYTERQKLLKRLQELDVLYSPAKQAELEAELTRLQNTVKEHQTAVQSLQNRINSLNMQVDHYGDRRQTLSSDLLDLLENSMRGLQQDLLDEENRLAEVRSTAETLKTRLEACLKERQQLHDWLDTDVTPLDTMIRALDRTEADELRKTLNPGRIEQVQTLRAEIRQRLEDLDQILDLCSRAAGLDRTMVDRMAGRIL